MTSEFILYFVDIKILVIKKKMHPVFQVWDTTVLTFFFSPLNSGIIDTQHYISFRCSHNDWIRFYHITFVYSEKQKNRHNKSI